MSSTTKVVPGGRCEVETEANPGLTKEISADPNLTPSPFLKRARETGSSGKQPAKKRRMNEKSLHLLVITKNEYEYNNITQEEYKKLCDFLLDKLFDGTDLNGIEPKIDWEDILGRKERRTKESDTRMVIACANDETADWVKYVVLKYDKGYRAWRKNEGPCVNRVKMFVKNPTGKRGTKAIVELMKRANEIQGGYMVLSSDERSDAKFIRLSIDENFMKRLEEIKFLPIPYCGLHRLRVESELNQ